MSLDTKGESCARCGAYLFEEDDIVYCPVCGAPHHRECYNSIGHCALESLHGTERQYSREKTAEKKEETGKNDDIYKTCNICGEKIPSHETRCPKCNARTFPNIPDLQNFDFLGGVPADHDIGEGVTAQEAKKFVLANTHRYIPKFALLNKSNKLSWNWGAFLIPGPWFLSRKMIKPGILLSLLTVITSLFSFPLNSEIHRLGIDEAKSYTEFAKTVAERLPQFSKPAIIISVVGLLISLAARIVFALFGDYIYKNYTISSIKKIRAESQDMESDYRKKGGVNLFLLLIAFMLSENLPSIIASFF